MKILQNRNNSEDKSESVEIDDNFVKTNFEKNSKQLESAELSRDPFSKICSICKQTFHNLKRHIESVHEKLKKYQCNACGKKFYQKSHLNEHIESVHYGKKRIKKNSSVHQKDKQTSSKSVLHPSNSSIWSNENQNLNEKNINVENGELSLDFAGCFF